VMVLHALAASRCDGKDAVQALGAGTACVVVLHALAASWCDGKGAVQAHAASRYNDKDLHAWYVSHSPYAPSRACVLLRLS
jgi:hypothetical protein